MDANFPAEPFEALGYNVAVSGQKTFNGVAILSKLPLEDVSRGLPGDPSDEQARFIAATISTPSGAAQSGLHLPAQRQPHQYRQIHLQNQLDGPAFSVLQ